jgi:hypothetical protein
MSGLSNRPTLSSVRTMPVGEAAALPAEYLALLQEEAAAALEACKQQKDWLDGAIALRFSGRADEERRAAGKDTGTVRFEHDGVTVVADLPKKVEWEQRLIADMVERIRAAGEDPTQYVEITIKVPERKYVAWPDNIRAAFAPARTVKTGKQTFKLSLSSEEANRSR